MPYDVWIWSGQAVGIGILHTLAGPDHYLPFAALPEAQDPGRGRLFRLVLACGLLHCLAGLGVALVAVALGLGAGPLAGLEAARGLVLGLGLVLFGLLLVARAMRRRSAAAAAPGHRPLLWLLFAVGPCEWLVPTVLLAAAAHGPVAILPIAAAFSLATIGTMIAAVALAAGAFRSLPASWRARHASLAAGFLMAASGAAVLLGA
jgi:nickel/cobalt exporter